MKQLLVLLAGGLLIGGTASYGSQAPSGLLDSGKAFVDLLAKGALADAVKAFDPTMTSLVSPDKLKQIWDSLAPAAGAFKRQTAVRYEKSRGYDFVFVTCEFERTSLDVKLVYDKSGRITGLGFVDIYQPPSYARFDSFTEREVEIGAGEWVLPGTLTVPNGAGPFRAVVLVHGSGPNDRDETLGPNKPFRDLAHGLATRGVAVLRYDKRSKVYGAKLAAWKGKLTVKEESIDDALAAVVLLRQTPGISPGRIFVLGHSLGGTLAPHIGELDAKLAGLIVMAGAARPFEELIVQQLAYIVSLGGPGAAAAQAQLDQAKVKLARLKDPSTPETETVLGASVGYWLDLGRIHPADDAAALKKPMLILQGERDYQVTMEDFALWKKSLSARGDVELKSYPKLNHLFGEGTGKSTPAEYQSHASVPEYVVADIAEWIKKH